MQTQYIVEWAHDLVELQQKVNDRIKKNENLGSVSASFAPSQQQTWKNIATKWQCQGGITVVVHDSGRTYYQAMILVLE